MPLWKQFLTACLLAFSSMLFSCDAMVGNHITGVMKMPDVTETVIEKAPVAGNLQVAEIDTTAKPSCSALMGDTVIVQTFTQGDISITPVENITPADVLPPPLPIEQPDTSHTIPIGKIAYDTSRIINPDAIDTAKPVKKSNECGNDFINL